ncbi:hypothetical protein niasHT_010885 [Heterodera trifolii]|uniref:Uncharacterized protein n=1 Tax=Heterodera trifolii TaxID=157864 RepID=A0ABD2LKS9_9BILA
MALIYASAVNKRMHQLQKKRSMDITSPNNELLSQQMSTSISYSTRGRPSQREGVRYGASDQPRTVPEKAENGKAD